MNVPTRSATHQACSRRQFLGMTAATGAALGTLPLARRVHAAGSDVIKVGLIGCGGRGSGAAANAMNAGPDVRLVAMSDIFEDRVRVSRANLTKMKPDQVAVDDAHCFVGFDAYQQVIDSDVDVVLIACASRFHPAYTHAAVAAGKHVFVEKPHAIDPPGIHVVQQACEAAEKKQLCLVSGLCWRYDRGVQETMQRVLDGAIGDLVAIQETYMRSTYRNIERQPGWSELAYQFRNWYHFRWLSGDDGPQSLLHSVDKGAWALREETPVKAFGCGGRSSCFSPVHGDVFDHGAIVFEYASGVRMYANVRAQDGCFSEVSDTFLGTKGRCDLLKNRIEGEHPWQYDGPKSNMYDAEHVALFEAIRRGQPINNGLYMVRSTMLSLLGQMVCYTGQQLTWDQALNSTWQAGPEAVSWDMEPPAKLDASGLYPVPIPGMTKLA